MPYLMCRDKENKTALQTAIQNKDISLVSNILESLIKGDKHGLLYSEYINPHILDLKQLGTDLKPYFNSLIAYHKIDESNENFKSYLSNQEY